jgi:Protein of unknown function (DUF3592)
MKKVFPLIWCLLFGIPFTVGGVFAGILPIAKTTSTWVETRNWIPIQADVISAELKRSNDSEGSTTYRVEADYRYQFGYAGVEYRAKRVGLDYSGSDNIGEWHQHIMTNLLKQKIITDL